jgi:A/G-specific adenine glycosylase
MSTSTDSLEEFRRAVLANYRLAGRSLPWRETRDPYAILVSEIMLQQTQVGRVIPKYGQWLSRFPTIETLAGSALSEVLTQWSGLGYNRRGKWLRDCAAIIRDEHGGRVPSSPEVLDGLPGIGRYTSRAISTFAYGIPNVFIETNIRRVFIHFFFQERSTEEKVRDAEIEALVEASLDREDPRSWYYALMDYGALLPKYVENPNKKSAHYSLQSPLKGSLREARGRVLRLLSQGPCRLQALFSEPDIEPERMKKAACDLEAEGMLVCEKGFYRLSD